MKVIFLVEKKEKIKDVYLEEFVNKNMSDLLPMDVYTKEDVLMNKKQFYNVKYIFSTWYMPVFTEKEIRECFPTLEAVFYAAGTVKYFAEPFLKCGIKVFSAAMANAVPVAEYTVAQILLANKGYFQAQRAYRVPLYKVSYKRAHQFVSSKKGNYNAKVGVIGAGSIGKIVIDLLKPYKLDLYVADPYVSEEILYEMGAVKVDLPKLFEICDVISNHLPDIPETKNILDYTLFGAMKSTATFINTGRGAQVVERDLIRVLKEKPNTCALLDVARHEPLWPWSPLNYLPNVFTTPHIAGSMSQEKQRLVEYICVAYEDYINGKENLCEVTLEKLIKMT